jgi:hypothetical protein
MLKIVETPEEFNNFITESAGYDWLIVPTYSHGSKSVYTDQLSIIYVYVLYADKEYVLVYNHTEGLNLPMETINDFPEDVKLFVHNKKRFLNFSNRKNLIDIDLIEYFRKNTSIEEDFETTAHEFFLKSFSMFSNLNCIIPIVKHIEKAQSIRNKFLDLFEFIDESESFNRYNQLMIENFHEIEKAGMYVDEKELHTFYPDYPVQNNMVYTEYNMYTSTGRPSNRFNGINFAGLNKESGIRKAFTSRFPEGYLVSFDYESYHLRLLGELVDYDFPKTSVHEYLGKLYFQKESLTPEEYKESKSITFRQLYGGISDELKSVPFFAKIIEYTKLLWESYRRDGYIETPMFHRKLDNSFLTDQNPSKLLNYLLQAFETERNSAVIHNVLQRIQSFDTKLILYTYDSFLFDFNKNDGTDLIKTIKKELEQSGKYPVKIEIGKQYQDLIEIKRK